MILRLSVFAGLLLLFLFWEKVLPRREQGDLRRNRITNLILSGVNSAVGAVVPVGAALIARSAEAGGAGFLNRTGLPLPAEWVISLILLDLLIYLQHLMFHAVPLLWQLHKTHHADSDLNVTTAVRFHPVEILLSLLIKGGAVYVLGAPAGAVVLFEILLNGCSLFNHANMFIPFRADRLIRLVLVTPDMHRIHHSVRIRETDSNFGFCLTWWDRLLGTYRSDPAAPQESMTLGISCYRKKEERSAVKSLLMPFDGKGAVYSLKGIGRM